MRLCVCMVVWVVVGGLLLPLKALEVPPVQFTTYTTIKLPNARYALWDGVAVAIEAIEARGGTVSVGTVMDELYEMHRRNDVKLPFSPSWRGKRKRPTIPNSKKRDKLEFESQLAKYIANHVAQSNGGEVVAAPTPGRYRNRQAFISAYVAYKMENAGEDIREEYSRKIGGMNDYRREMIHEATRIWREVKGR